MQDKKPVIYNTSRFRSCYEAWGKNLMACISFAAEEGEEVIVKTSVSAVSTAGAMLNLQELNGMTFDALREKGVGLWEKELSKYQIEAKPEVKEAFYTAAYRAALHPFIFRMRMASSEGWIRTLRKPRVLPITLFSHCGIHTVPCIPGLTWYIRMSMQTLPIRCWLTMIKV